MFDQFEWDDAKNESNFLKHRLRFEEALEIFRGPVLTRSARHAPGGERREVSLGRLGNTVVLAVIHTNRYGNVRIISARRASRSERRAYDAYLEKALGRN